MRFFQGQRILCRGEEWEVCSSEKLYVVGGGEVWKIHAIGRSGIVVGEEYCFLSDIDSDIEILNPADIKIKIDDSPVGKRAKLYLEANLRRLLPRNGALFLGQHGAIDSSLEYQKLPASIALNMIRPRILIGDAVGLGKTIECGILLSELIRRGKGQRVLCAVPQAILEQFQMEMWGRFSIAFQRLDSRGLQRLKEDLPSMMNPFFHFDKVIISIDTLKLKNYQRYLEQCNWDVLIIDETHNVANRSDGLKGSLRHRVAKRLAKNARSVILMSATPHDGKPYSFASLIKLLDRTLIPHDEKYTRDDFKRHFIRRTRASLKEHFGNKKQRIQKLISIPLTEEEIHILQYIHDIKFQTKLLSKKKKGQRELFKTTLKKSFLSSPAALEETLKRKIKNLDKTKEGVLASGEQDAEMLRNILADVSALKGKFSRLDFLEKFLRENPPSKDDRIVIFTERIKTLEAIRNFLLEKKLANNQFQAKSNSQPSGVLLATVQGSTSDVDIQKIVKSFQSDLDNLQILIATNVASEGLNLHVKCHRMIHFDLPWSFITLEQRSGRIDRLGQKKTPKIYYFASRAEKDTRESNIKDLDDDFWIVRKLQARIKQAAEDMDEEAYAKGAFSGESEEEKNTEEYEEGLFSSEQEEQETVSSNPLMALIARPNIPEGFPGIPPKQKQLPTLFEKSPGDFVKGVAAEVNLQAKRGKNGSVFSLKLDQRLRQEAQQWPKEFCPVKEEQHLNLESDALEMAAHFEERRAYEYRLQKAFLNEIHPAIELLEREAMGFFSGKEVPLVPNRTLKKDQKVFLVQGTLFNELNEIVLQIWQPLIINGNQSQPKPLFDGDLLHSDYIQNVASWIREDIFGSYQAVSISELELKRIEHQSKQALDYTEESLSCLRKERRQILIPKLKKEEARIKEWERKREQYLNEVTKLSNSKNKHAGIMAQIRNAHEELSTLGRDSEKFNEFIRKNYATNENAVLRILAVFLGV